MSVGGGGNVEDGEEGDAYCLFLCWELLEIFRENPELNIGELLTEDFTR